MPVKIIIVYASAGSGHRRAAESINQYLKENYPGINVIFLDILEYVNAAFCFSYSRGYSFLVTHLKFLWAVTYHITNLKPVACLFKSICRLNSCRFINLLIKENPDVVIATHFFPAEVVAYLKQKGKITARLMTVITDLGLHCLWISKGCDDYIVGSDYTLGQLINRGIKQNKIHVLGVPINHTFLAYSKKTKQQQEGLTALLVTGSFGFPFMEKIVDRLIPQVRLIVVCGKNQKLYNKLKRKNYPGMQLLGFTDDMPGLMSQADFIITKPGGLTIAEALVMQLPLVFISRIPGRETENAQVIENCGCGFTVGGLNALYKAVVGFKSHPEKLSLMRVNIRKIRKPQATEDICKYILQV